MKIKLLKLFFAKDKNRKEISIRNL